MQRSRVLWGSVLALAAVAVALSRTRAGGDVIEDIWVSAQAVAGEAWPYPRGQEYAPLLYSAEAKYGIPQGQLVRQAWMESRFRNDIITGLVRSSAGAVGIMQIIPRWHPEIGELGALDPRRAIPYAAKYVAQLKKQFGSWPLAFAAYNFGPGNVQKKLTGAIDQWPSETLAYVREITGVQLA